MPKNIKFVCTNCGNVAPKWMGRCSECGEWNSYEEFVETSTRKPLSTKTKAKKLKEIQGTAYQRTSTGMTEFDRVLGGGIVKGSLTLVGGDPGIGKSTLLLQMAAFLSKNQKVLYVSGEESAAQIKLRSDRLRLEADRLTIYSENNYENILEELENDRPDILIVDSIQTIATNTVSSQAGSVSQVKEVTSSLMQISKGYSLSTFIVGHVTKSGNIAGPKLLEHIVDAVLYFEGEQESLYRILRGVKNRFGSTNEVGLFAMGEIGLEEVKNPSELFLSQDTHGESGTVIYPSLEGTRPLLVELQALVAQSYFPAPRRNAIGVDYQQLIMAIAILEKKCNLRLYDQDVYLNAVGGLKISEPGASLAMALSMASSLLGIPISQDVVVFGELGLLGEVRRIPQMNRRLLEASKLGYKKAITPVFTHEDVGMEIIQISHIKEAFEQLFRRSNGNR